MPRKWMPLLFSNVFSVTSGMSLRLIVRFGFDKSFSIMSRSRCWSGSPQAWRTVCEVEALFARRGFAGSDDADDFDVACSRLLCLFINCVVAVAICLSGLVSNRYGQQGNTAKWHDNISSPFSLAELLFHCYCQTTLQCN